MAHTAHEQAVLAAAKAQQIARSLDDTAYAESFVEAEIATTIPFQIRVLRKERNWTQSELADKTEQHQKTISDFENPDIGPGSIASLLKIAAAFDVGLIVRFAPFSELVDWSVGMTRASHFVPSREKDAKLRSLAQTRAISSLPEPVNVASGQGEAVAARPTPQAPGDIGLPVCATDETARTSDSCRSPVPEVEQTKKEADPTQDGGQCSGCGGTYRYDTSMPSAIWNRVIRPLGLPEYLCAACIIREFARQGVSFTAELFGDGFSGLPIEVRVNGAEAQDAALVQEQNNNLRAALSKIHDDAEHVLDAACAAVPFGQQAEQAHQQKGQ